MTIWYGGDYNPEQWERSVWDDDIALMQQAGVTLVTVGVFSWAWLEPREGEFDFEWLDDIIERLHAADIRVDLATATASPPPWLTTRYPDALPVDEHGRTLSPGSRQHYCPSSPDYRRLAARLVGTLVERYAEHPAIALWHVNNEYGCHVSRCYCDESGRAFRRWLAARYGDIATLNEAWGTAFWSQRYSDFDEILPPRAAPTWRNPGQLLDFERFSSDELLECYRAEVDIIRRLVPSAVVTTNFMGLFRGVDYWRWAAEVDVVSDDAYPDPNDPESPIRAAMTRDLMRSLRGGQPWMLMEQSTSAVNWRPVNARKRPGQMRALSMQAIARGADAVMFFQWRQSDRGAERFHSGMLPHAGTSSRIWREVEQLGHELEDLSAVAGTTVESTVAIVLDWDSWWSLDQQAMPSTIDYPELVYRWYRALHGMGVAVDFIPTGPVPERYRRVIVPALFCVSDEDLRSLAAVVDRGDHLIVSFLTGTTDLTGRVRRGGYLGSLADVLGVRVEEFAPMPQQTGGIWPVAVALKGSDYEGVSASLWAEDVVVTDAEVVARLGGGELAGAPAITGRAVAEGSATYVATQLDADGLHRVLESVGVAPRIVEIHPVGAIVDLSRRGEQEYLVNLSDHAVSVTLRDAGGATERVDLDPWEVVIRILEPTSSLG